MSTAGAISLLSSVVVWFAMAIPISIIARRLGKSRWVPFIVWCPIVTLGLGATSFNFLRSILLAAVPGAVSIITWSPAALYFWYLALSSRQKSAAAIFE